MAVIQREFGVTQPAVSQHLKVLRENGFATVQVAGNRRLYALDQAPLREVDAWLAQFRPAWVSPLDALAALSTEVARGRRARRPADRPAVPADTENPPSTTEKRNVS